MQQFDEAVAQEEEFITLEKAVGGENTGEKTEELNLNSFGQQNSERTAIPQDTTPFDINVEVIKAREEPQKVQTIEGKATEESEKVQEVEEKERSTQEELGGIAEITEPATQPIPT